MKKEVVYLTSGERARGRVCSYHGKPSPFKLNKAYRADVESLKPVVQANAVTVLGDEVTSKFTIGFEVEKNQLHRDAIREYELFCGFEQDNSCGYEAVTHVLPLLPSGLWRNKVYDMMHKAERIIDDRFSPSSNNCGGHATITCVGMDGEELLSKIRLNSAILLALFRNRLTNTFCRHNLTMLPTSDSAQWFNGYHSKYNLAKYVRFPDGTSGIEFRVISRFESVKQMMRRYELMYEIVNISVNKPQTSYASFLKVIKPIIISMYNGNVDKAEKIMELSKSFHRMIKTGNINAEVHRYVDPRMQMRSIYERGVSNAVRRNSINGVVDELADSDF